MNQYDPNVSPLVDEWLALDEDERLELVMDFHSEVEDRGASREVHASIHVIVENQIAMEVENVPRTLAKLIRQGLNRHEAIHAIGAIITQDTFSLLKGHVDAWDSKRYRRKLEKLTAKRWRKGQI